jgi:hypothetical protein
VNDGCDQQDPLGDQGRTSLMVVPPEEICRAADLYRRECHPAAFERLPAHMTVIYPYAPRQAWPGLLPDLERNARDVSPFEVRLTAWSGGPGGFAWVPDDPGPFMSMRAQFMAATPEEYRPTHPLRPHLTIGWSPEGALAKAWERVKVDLVNHAFTIDHLWLCGAGEGGYWKLERRLGLGARGD